MKTKRTNPFTAQYEVESIRKYVDGFDLSMFSQADYVNIVLQRSSVLYDIPKSGQIIRSWSEGDEAPMRAIIETHGDLFLRRAIADNYAEFLAMKPVFETLAPQKVADIGAGYGFMDIFIAEAYGAACLLIDIESNESRHFGFANEGAAYSDLSVARDFAKANGVGDKISTINPEKEDLYTHKDFDLISSYLSCGFHYPFNTYWQFYRDCLRENGALLFDLRIWAEKDKARLVAEGAKVTTLWETRRIMRLFVEINGRLQGDY